MNLPRLFHSDTKRRNSDPHYAPRTHGYLRVDNVSYFCRRNNSCNAAHRAPPPPQRWHERRPRLPPRPAPRHRATGAPTSAIWTRPSSRRSARRRSPSASPADSTSRRRSRSSRRSPTGWLGTPGLAGHRDGRHFSTKLVAESIDVDDASTTATVTATDAAAGLAATDHPRGDPRRPAPPAPLAREPRAGAVLRSARWPRPSRCRGTSTSCSTPPAATCASASPQRRAFTFGTHLRESRRGRPGADATPPARRRPPGLRVRARAACTASTSPGAATTASLAERVDDRRGVPRRRRAARARRGRPRARASRYATPWVDRLVGRRAHRAVAPLPRRVARAARSIRAARAR